MAVMPDSVRWMAVVKLHTFMMLIPTVAMIWVVPYIDRWHELGDERFSQAYERQIAWAGVGVWQAAWALSAVSLLHMLLVKRPSWRVALFVIVGGVPVYFWGAAFVYSWANALAHDSVYFPIAQIPAWGWWAVARLLLAVSYLGAAREEATEAAIEGAVERLATHRPSSVMANPDGGGWSSGE